MSADNHNFGDSMFNFEFLHSDELDTTKPRADGSEAQPEFEKLSSGTNLSDANLSGLNSSESDSGSATQATCGITAGVKFDTAMERDATRYFPLATLRELLIVPVSFNAKDRTLTVFCLNPDDDTLRPELRKHLRSPQPLTLNLEASDTQTIHSLIDRIEETSSFFESVTAAPDSQTTVAEPRPSIAVHRHSETDSLSDLFSKKQSQREPSESPSALQCVLFVTPETRLSPHLLFALRAEKIEPLIAGNCDDALIRFPGNIVRRALIHTSFRDSCGGLVSALRSKYEQTAISFYSSEAGLLTGEVSDLQTTELFEKNLRLAAYLSDSPASALLTHNTEVADLCRHMSDKFNFTSNCRLALLSAAHWHALAARDLKAPKEYKQSDIIALSASRMKALDTPPAVIHLLHLMAQPDQDVAQVDVETALAGCTLAIVDYYCHHWPIPSAVASEQLYEIRSDILKFAETLSRPEVADALLEIIDEELIAEQPDSDSFSVHLLDLATAQSPDIEQALHSAGFYCTVSRSISDCTRQWAKEIPQALIILHTGDVQEITDTLFALALNSINIATTPTMLLVPENILEKVIWSIKHGIEDVFPLTLNSDILIAKIARAQKRIENLARVRISAFQDLGTHGSLEDMNLIKLLEVLRDSPRPLRLSVTAEGWQLTVFVKDNCVLAATCNELTGIDAISQSLEWTRGVWSIDPISEPDLPKPNLGLSIDSVTLEACVKCDRSTRMSAEV